MKKLMAVLAAIAGFLSIYAAIAWFQIRGLRVYTIHSSLGAVFANSWLICAAAAGILWLFVMILACAGRGRKAKKEGAQRQGKSGKGRGKSKGKEQLIEPKRPGTAQNPVGSVSPGFSEMPQPQRGNEAGFCAGRPVQQPMFQEGAGGQTEFMGNGKEERFPGLDDGRTEFIEEPRADAGFSGVQDDGRTEFTEEPRAGVGFSGVQDDGRTEFIEEPRASVSFSGVQDDGRTEFIEEPKAGAGFSGVQDESRTEFADNLRMPDELDMSNSWMGESVKEEAAGPLYCGHCGAQLAKGQKFCMKCGTKVGSV